MRSPPGCAPSNWAALLVVVVRALLVPVFAIRSGHDNIAVFTAMYVGLATAWNIMGGYTGYVSLGHAAFFGFGAYAFGLVLAHLGIQAGTNPFCSSPSPARSRRSSRVVIGWIALRTRAATFVIVTIAMMFMVQLLAENLVGLTGGGSGLSFPVPPWSGDFFNTPFYYAMLLMALVAACALVVDPALEVRPRPARDPRRRGQSARGRRAGTRIQAHRVHHQRRRSSA